MSFVHTLADESGASSPKPNDKLARRGGDRLIAIAKDSKVVFAKSYGARKLADHAPFNEHTLCAIGSATKAFIAAALAILVDKG